jgi:cytoskeletal protein RodZ
MGTMPMNDSVISLADLSAAGVRLHPSEAATLVREIALQVGRGEIDGVPTAESIRLSSAGSVSIVGPITGGPRVTRAARLLEFLLPGFDAAPEFRVPGALRLVVARALGTLDVPPYPSIQSFADALSRFAASDPAEAVRDLIASYSAAMEAISPEPGGALADREPLGLDVFDEEVAVSEPPPVVDPYAASAAEFPLEADTPPDGNAFTPWTISDIRRARRATGLALAEIAMRSRIPISLLRELEWGYFRNWPAGHYARTQLVRYARAAELDEQRVVRTVWPLIEEAAHHRAAVLSGQAPDIPIHPTAQFATEPKTATVTSIVPVPSAHDVLLRREHSRRMRVLAALAIPALLAIALLPAVWNRSGRTDPVSAPQAEARAVPTRAADASVPVTVPSRPVDTTSPVAATSGAEQPAASRSGTPAPRGPRQPPSEPATAARVVSAADVDTVTDARRADGIPSGAVAYSPTFATVGTAMFYHAEAGGRSALMRADTDGDGAVLRITSIVDDRSRNFHARPSPDGTRVAFDSDRDGERAVYVTDSDGRNVRRVSGEGFAAVPSWSPDGRSLAYVRAEPGRPRVWNLWLTDLQSGQERRLTSHPVGQPWGASWFPDGRRIAYSHETRLIVRDLISGAQRIYPSPRKGRLVRTPAVSPDGRRIMFQVFRDGAWLLEMSDGSMRRVLADPSAEEYTWSPDGRRVAYHSRRSGDWGVWLMAAR